MANGKIDVYFHDGSGDGQTEDTNGQESVADKKKESNKSISKSAIATTTIQYAKQTLNYGVSVFGDLTGDYQSQRQMQSVLNASTTLVMLANFPVGTIGASFSMATQLASQLISQRNANYESELLRKRIGKESYNNSEGD